MQLCKICFDRLDSSDLCTPSICATQVATARTPKFATALTEGANRRRLPNTTTSTLQTSHPQKPRTPTVPSACQRCVVDTLRRTSRHLIDPSRRPLPYQDPSCTLSAEEPVSSVLFCDPDSSFPRTASPLQLVVCYLAVVFRLLWDR